MYDLAHFSEGYRVIVIIVYTHIILSRKELFESGTVKTCTLLIGMYVPKELPCVSIGSAIAQERIVVQVYPLFTNGYEHLHSDTLEPAHKTLTHIVHVVVAYNQINPSIQTL